MSEKEEPKDKKKGIKVSIKDMLKAQAMMARMGLRLSKDQADAAVEGIQLFQHIVSLSVEANTYVYDNHDMVKLDADFTKALALVQQAKDEVLAMKHNASPLSSMFSKMQEQLDSSLKDKFRKLCIQQVTIERLRYGLPADPESDATTIYALADKKVIEEWI